MKVKLPPHGRTPVWKTLTQAASKNCFVLQRCEQCQHIQYPPREICRQCFADELIWEEMASAGELIANTTIEISTNAYFRDYGAVNVGLVKLDCGPSMFVHLVSGLQETGLRVRVVNRADLSGESVFIALPEESKDESALSELEFIVNS